MRPAPPHRTGALDQKEQIVPLCRGIPPVAVTGSHLVEAFQQDAGKERDIGQADPQQPQESALGPGKGQIEGPGPSRSAGKDPQRAPVPLQLDGKLVDLKLLPGRLGIKGALQKPGPPLEDQIKCLDKGGVKGLPEFGRHLVLQRPVQPGLRGRAWRA